MSTVFTTNGNNIDAGTGQIKCNTIVPGSGTEISTNNNSINAGSGSLTCNTINFTSLGSNTTIPASKVTNLPSATTSLPASSITAANLNIDTNQIQCGFIRIGTSSNVSGAPGGEVTGTTGVYYSLIAYNYIATKGSYITFSDKRIKDNIKLIESSNSLQIIRELNPVKYNSKDSDSNRLSYGFIAQDVHKQLPDAVFMHKEHIPNVNSRAKIVNKNIITLLKSNTNCVDNLIPGAKLQYYLTSCSTPHFITVKNVLNNTTFVINEELQYDEIFIYGQEVDDFHTLDYNTIYLVSLSALKQVDQELQETKEIVKTQQSQIDSLTQQLADLKILVQSILPKTSP